MSGNIQSVRFNKAYWTTKQARAYMKLHGFKPIKKTDQTKNWYRYRLLPPSQFKRFLIKVLPNHIQLVIGQY
jgi:N-acetylglutamate synthase-like GNAT family acetyltransferase